MILVEFLLSFAVLMIAMTVHEFAHGFVAYKFGDNTAKHSGRLTLNPLAHIDPIGTFLLPLLLFISTQGRFVFGAAKPVPVNYWALKNPKQDMIWIGFSGPLANFLFAFLLSLLWKIIPPFPVTEYLFKQLIYINVILGTFNLIPIPPLDGSRILMGLLPENLANKYALIEPYGFIIVIGLVALGVFDRVVWPISEFILKLVLFQ